MEIAKRLHQEAIGIMTVVSGAPAQWQRNQHY